MRGYDWARLLGLACLWSLQYIFMRLAVPAFGTGLVAEMRALSGALVLIAAALVTSQRIAPLAHWRDHLTVSLTNNVLPFACFAYAAASLPAGYLSIINGTVPLFTVLFAGWLLGERLGPSRIAGFVLGLIGVALIVNLGPVALDAGTLLATAAGLLGAASWAWASVLIKQRTGKLPAIGFAAGSMAFAALLMTPSWITAPAASWTPAATASAIALGALCSGVAYLAFFTLVRDIGPSRTLTVGFTIPALGVLWGWLFLDEPVTLSMVAGGGLVLAAMAIVLKR